MLDGDIVINNEDVIIGFVNIDGKVVDFEQSTIGKVVSPNLVVDNNGKIIGHTYRIGANILSNEGNYLGRLSSDGNVLSITNGKIGYLKNNGTYTDT